MNSYFSNGKLLLTSEYAVLGGAKALALPCRKGQNLEFKKKVVAGDRLNIETEIISWKRGIGKCFGKGTVSDQTVCQAEFTIVDPVELSKYKLLK